MRLLKFDEQGELSLTRDLTDDIPPYAILSHTWGADDDELTFEDLSNIADKKSKGGYQKIRFCGEQARKDKLDHFWVDTCCIHKANFTELSEAITSMFRWYSNAVKCYVYLSDVSAPQEGDTGRSQPAWEPAFRKCKWFTRGWTLQELLAPRSVEFFSRDGKMLGDKQSLNKLIHDITTVPITALCGAQLSDFDVDERLRWAANRKTKKKEDEAYCLLGIFEVYIPLIYGEGENSFIRLREQIYKLSKTQPESLPLPSHNIPFRRDRDFVEREGSNDLWQRALEPGAHVGLVGLGGVGKTQLAIENAYRIHEKYPEKWVFWVHASSVARFEDGYRNIAAQLQLPGWSEPKADVLSLVHTRLSGRSVAQWMMVVDNADDADIMFEPYFRESSTIPTAMSATRSLSDYLPLCSSGSVVITSRSEEVVKRLQVFDDDLLHVEPMDVDVARSLLLKKLKKAGRGTSVDDMTRLVDCLDCMPLAISQAAAYIEQSAPRMTVIKYMDMLQQNDSELAKLLQKDIPDPRRDRQASNSIIMTWHVTFTHLQTKCQPAARLLALMSLFDREAIPEDLLRGQYTETQDDVSDFEDDIAILRMYSLIGAGMSDHSFEMHRLVQLSTQKWLAMHGKLEEWQRRYIEILSSAFPAGDFESWTTCQALFPHVLAMEMYQVTSERHSRLWAEVSERGAWYCRERGQFEMAEKMIRASLGVLQTILEPDDLAILYGMVILELVLQDQGKFEQAEDMARRVLTGYEEVLGVDHPDTLMSANNLALVLVDQGMYHQAGELHRRVLVSSEKLLGVDHPDTLTSMNNLATVLVHQGKYKQAEELNRRALVGREKALGVDRPATLKSMGFLAVVFRSQEKYEQAEELNRRALVGLEKALGFDHHTTLWSTESLAVILRCQGQYEQAEEMNRRALAGMEKALGVDHPHTLQSVDDLATLLEAIQDRQEEALQLYDRAVNGLTKVLGMAHPHTQACQRRRVLLLEKMNSSVTLDAPSPGQETHLLSEN